MTVSGPTETKVDVVVRRLDISRSSTPATGVCGVAELYGTTLVPPGSAHEFAGVLWSGARRRDGAGAGGRSRSWWNGKFRVGNERIEPKTIFGTPKRGVRRFKWVPLDLNHLQGGG